MRELGRLGGGADGALRAGWVRRMYQAGTHDVGVRNMFSAADGPYVVAREQDAMFV